jgi:predicted nucleic acid-binding protein
MPENLGCLSKKPLDSSITFARSRTSRRIHFLWRPTLSDPGDEFVLELAVAAGCKVIVTHSTKDFRGAERFGITIVTPGEFLVSLEEES